MMEIGLPAQDLQLKPFQWNDGCLQSLVFVPQQLDWTPG